MVSLADLADTEFSQGPHRLISQSCVGAFLLAAAHLLTQLCPAHRALGLASQGVNASHQRRDASFLLTGRGLLMEAQGPVIHGVDQLDGPLQGGFPPDCFRQLPSPSGKRHTYLVNVERYLKTLR